MPTSKTYRIKSIEEARKIDSEFAGMRESKFQEDLANNLVTNPTIRKDLITGEEYFHFNGWCVPVNLCDILTEAGELPVKIFPDPLLTDEEIAAKWPDCSPYKVEHVTFSYIDYKTMQRFHQDFYLGEEEIEEIQQFLRHAIAKFKK